MASKPKPDMAAGREKHGQSLMSNMKKAKRPKAAKAPKGKKPPKSAY